VHDSCRSGYRYARSAVNCSLDCVETTGDFAAEEVIHIGGNEDLLPDTPIVLDIECVVYLIKLSGLAHFWGSVLGTKIA
jgi:hypothetical protein